MSVHCWACGPVSVASDYNFLRHLHSWRHYWGVARKIGAWPVLRSFGERAWWRVRSWVARA